MLEFNFKYFFPNNFFVLFSIVYFVSSIQGAGDEVPWVYCGKQIFYFYFKLQSIVLLQQSMTSEIQITVSKLNFFVLI